VLGVSTLSACAYYGAPPPSLAYTALLRTYQTIASAGRITIRFQARTDGLRLLRVINDTQTHGQEGVKADPSRAANEAGLEVGSERYQGAMAYLIEETALLGDEHTSIDDEGEQHAHGYASYFFHPTGAEATGGAIEAPIRGILRSS